MRGDDELQGDVLSYFSPKRRILQDHPLRTICEMVYGVLRELSPEILADAYCASGDVPGGP